MPLHDLPSHVLNLRHSLLSSLAIPLNYEANIITAVKARLAEQIPSFFPCNKPSSTMLDSSSAVLSQAVKSEVARYIRQTLIARLQLRNSFNLDPVDSDLHVSKAGEECPDVITLAQFQTLRRVLEEYGSFSVLADLLNILSTETQGSISAALCDTVNFHFDIFDAIGAAADLFRKLCDQLADLSGQEIVEKAFVESLVDLGRRLPETTQEIQKLRKHACLYAPKTLAAACSPISDNTVEANPSAQPTFADDMDQILAGGTSMDKQTLTRVFEMIMAHLEKTLQDPGNSISRIAQLLARLRGFDVNVFDFLFQEWLRRWLHSDSRPKLLAMLPQMVCFKVVSFKVALNTIAQESQCDNIPNDSLGLAVEALEVVIEAHSEYMPIVEFRAYRMSNQLLRLIRTDSSSLRHILRLVTASCASANSSVRMSALSQFRSPSVRCLFETVLLQSSRNTGKDDYPLCFDMTPLDSQQVTASLLYPDDPDNALSRDTRTRISNTLDCLSEFNIHLAQLELRTVLELATERSDELEAAFSEILIKQVIASTNVRLELLACIVLELPVGQATSIRERAEGELLAIFDIDSKTKVDHVRLHSLISIIEAATFSIIDGETTPFVEQVTQRLHHITALAPVANEQNNNSGPEDESSLVGLLLRLIVIHQMTIQNTRFPQNALSRLLIALSLLLCDLSISSCSSLQHQTLDVLTLLSDSLTDDTRARCIHTLRDQYRIKDPRLFFVFGYDEIVENEWLHLVTKTPSAAEGVATTITQPYALRRWEMMQDATPLATENDTSLSLSLFGARKSVL